jgi:general secretion pathway protein A
MYLDFYQLKKAPFHITPDPEFLFLSPSHKAALGSIIYGIEERQGFIAIIGEVGLGKTTILRSYLERIDEQLLKTIYIFNANISFRSLLKTIFREFEVDFASDDLFEMVNRLHQVLIEEYKQGRNVALIIDEAQNMPIETLENLRMLSNLETATEKLVQIVLIGQPEFENKLNLNELRQLKQRLVIRSTIAPLTEEESLAYIEHRLTKVAVTPEPLFTQGALRRIIAQAKGTPRALNILCTNALIAGFGYRQKPITARTVKEVIGETARPKKLPRLRTGFAWAAALVMCVGGFWASPYKESVVARIEQNKPAVAMVKEPAGTENHTITSPPQPQREPMLLQRSVLEALYPPQQQPGPLSQNTAPEAKRATLQRHEGVIKKPAEDSTQQRPELPPTAEDNTRQEQNQKSPAPWEEGKKVALPLLRVMQKGDYISKIALEVYGYTSDDILTLIKKHNPQIKDINRVEVGEKVLFPELHSAARSL